MDDVILVKMIDSEACLEEIPECLRFIHLLSFPKSVEEVSFLCELQHEVDVLFVLEVVEQLADVSVLHSLLYLYLSLQVFHRTELEDR